MEFLKFSLIALLVFSQTVSTGPASAQQKLPPGNIKFAVVNFEKIFREAAATRSITPQIVKLKKQFDGQFKDLQKQLQSVEQGLKGQRNILSPEAYAEKLKAFKKQVSGEQRNVQTVQRMVVRAEGNAYKNVRRAFHQITQEVAKERSLDLIFPRSGLVHVNSRYDISDAILKRLNKILPFVKVKLPGRANGRPKVSPKKKK